MEKPNNIEKAIYCLVKGLSWAFVMDVVLLVVLRFFLGIKIKDGNLFLTYISSTALISLLFFLTSSDDKINRILNADDTKTVKEVEKNSQTEATRAVALRAQQAREEREAQERARLAQAEADERAYWTSPEGRRVRAERELAEIRHRERQAAEATARRLAEEEHRRQQEALKAIKDL